MTQMQSGASKAGAPMGAGATAGMCGSLGLAEAIDRIELLTEKNGEFSWKLAKELGCVDGGLVLRNADGSVSWHKPPLSRRPKRDLGANTPLAMATVIAALAGEYKGVSVFVNGGAAIAVLGESEDRNAERSRRDAIRMTLRRTEAAQTLYDWQSKLRGLDQKQLVYLLRTTFKGMVNDAGLLPALRNVKFSQKSEGHGSVDHGSESMGRNVETVVASGTDKIGEEVTIECPMFEALGGQGPVLRAVCTITIDVDKQRFELRPDAIDLEDAKREADMWIADAIRENAETYFALRTGGDALDLDVFVGASYGALASD